MSLAAAIRAYDAESKRSTPTRDLSPAASSLSLASSEAPSSAYMDAPPPAPRATPAAYVSPASTGTASRSLRAAMLGKRVDELATPATLRKHEHLAVLLDRSLWKSDSQARECDTWGCSVRFTLFERRHHCRKCGGVFCATHSSRTTALLDTRHFATMYPPRGQPITDFATPLTPVKHAARVCDGCHDMLHGIPTNPPPLAPELIEALTPPVLTPTPARRMRPPTTRSAAHSSASASPVARTPPDGLPVPSRVASHPSHISDNRSGSRPPAQRRATAPPLPLKLDDSFFTYAPDATLGMRPKPPPTPRPLDKYPLREHSTICKRRASERAWRAAQQQQRVC